MNPPLGWGHTDRRLVETVDDRVARYRRLYPRWYAAAPAQPPPAGPVLDREVRELLAALPARTRATVAVEPAGGAA